MEQSSEMDDTNESAQIVRFGTFEADFRAAELRKNGLRVRLQEQPFRILQLLLERPGELVSREVLRERLWPADVFVAVNQGLNNAIKKLRAALGDPAENPRFIETVARHGYRFIAPVHPAPVVASRHNAPPVAAVCLDCGCISRRPRSRRLMSWPIDLPGESARRRMISPLPSCRSKT